MSTTVGSQQQQQQHHQQRQRQRHRGGGGRGGRGRGGGRRGPSRSSLGSTSSDQQQQHPIPLDNVAAAAAAEAIASDEVLASPAPPSLVMIESDEHAGLSTSISTADADAAIAASSDVISVTSSSTATGIQTLTHDYCLVCYTDDLPRCRTILPCGHDDICALCHLRLRFLHSDRRCPVCKSRNERIIVDSDTFPSDDEEQQEEGHVEGQHKTFEQYEIWGDDMGSAYTYRPDVGMFFPKDYYHTDVMPIFSLGCTVPGCDFTNETDSFVVTATAAADSNNSPSRQPETLDDDAQQQQQQQSSTQAKSNKKETKRLSGMKALHEHLRSKHSLTLCRLCVAAKRDFISKLPRFTPAQLKNHEKHGDGDDSGFKGHPLCEFCRPRRFYDLTKLHEHLNKDHYKCHVCERQGKHNQFFKNYDKLALHFDREHFLCYDPQCLAARFVVFENEIDLIAHERTTHGGSSSSSRANGGSTKIQLEFRVRRIGGGGNQYENQEVPSDEDFQYGLDGEAFVPDALPVRQENEPDISHPLHAARTAEIRQVAARVREEQARVSQEEAFPSLGAAGQETTAASAVTGSGAAGGASGMEGSRPLVGWTAEGRAGIRAAARPRGVVREEEFPSLPTAPKKKSIIAATPRPFISGGAAGSNRSVSWAASAASASSALASKPPPAAASSAAAPIQPFVKPAPSVPIVRNRAEDLSPDNFPALGKPSVSGGTSTTGAAHRYAAAEALARKNAAKKQGGTSSAPPSLSNTLDFPPPPSSSAANKKKPAIVHEQKAPSKEVLDNVLNFPPPPSSSNQSLASSKATVDNMKAILGPAKYKKLKHLTKDFATSDIDPEQYIDRASALFDEGIRDDDFWSFVPSLIMSCPNERSSTRAMHYLESLRLANEMQEQAYRGASSSSAASTAGGGGGGGVESSGSGGYAAAASAISSGGGVAALPSSYHTQATLSSKSAARSAPPMNYGAAATSLSSVTPTHMYATAPSYSARGSINAAGKKKNAWGGGGGAALTTKVAAAPPGSVAALVAQETHQTGTATKGMAKIKADERRQKQLESQMNQGGGDSSKQSKKTKQKKKNDELRALAFGGR